jgi:hypothetical protein
MAPRVETTAACQPPIAVPRVETTTYVLALAAARIKLPRLAGRNARDDARLIKSTAPREGDGRQPRRDERPDLVLAWIDRRG